MKTKILEKLDNNQELLFEDVLTYNLSISPITCNIHKSHLRCINLNSNLCISCIYSTNKLPNGKGMHYEN